jgi:hypothetical protein
MRSRGTEGKLTEGWEDVAAPAKPGERRIPATAPPDWCRNLRRVVWLTPRQCSREPAAPLFGGKILSTLDYGVLLLSARVCIDGFRRMMAIAAVVGGWLAVPNDPVSRTQWGFDFRDRGRRRRWWRRRGRRRRIVGAANQNENRHRDKDQPYAGNNSIGGVSRFSQPHGNIAGKIATLSETAHANFRLRNPLHSPSPSSILLIIRKIPEFAGGALIFRR